MTHCKHPAFYEKSCEFIAEIDAELLSCQHKATGARLFVIPCEDENRAFALSFRTPAEDESGKAHILEHCSLSGSERYPLKEPFVALMKSSLASFLNAMTFEDRTVYPFASPNRRDFQNLLSVYLDSVFHPLVLQEPLIFQQEAWHLEEAENGEARFTGVVCNEMSGDASSPSEILTEIYRKNLYDNAYRYISGGRPRGITGLSWEELKAFHKKNYHPANADFFLYGKLDLEECLQKIDAVIRPFGGGQRRGKIPAARPIHRGLLLEDLYPSQDTSVFAGLHFVLPEKLSREDATLLRVIADTLFQRDFSPVRDRFLEEGICDDCYVSFEGSQTNPSLELCLSGVHLQSAREVESFFLSALRELDEEKVKELALASLARRAFVLREKNSGSLPLGLIYAMDLLLAPEAKEPPAESLKYEERLLRVKARIEAGEIPEMIRCCLSENQHRAVVFLRPNPELAERLETEEKERARHYYRALDETALSTLREQNRRLKELQERPETEAALRSLPKLTLLDLPRSNRFKSLKVEEAENLPLLYYPAFSSGISYLGFHFRTSGASEHELFLMNLLQEALASIASASYHHTEISHLLFARTGGFSTSLGIYPDNSYFHVSLNLMEEESRFGLKLLAEILTRSKFSEVRRLDLLYRGLLDSFRTDLIDNGVSYASERAASGISPTLRASCEASGLGFFFKLRELMKAGEEKRASLYTELGAMARKLFTRGNLTLSYIGSAQGKERFVLALPSFLSEVPEAIQPFCAPVRPLQPLREAYALPSTVQDTALAFKLSDEKAWRFKGQHQLLRSILEKDYLWKEIRVLGGAYGGGISLRRSGEVLLSSYRDPRLRESLEVFRKLPDYLENFFPSEEEWEGYKIGTVADYDLPLSLQSEGKAAIYRYLRGLSLEDLQREREEILDARPEELRELAPAFRSALEKASVCVFGAKQKIEQNRDLFDHSEVLL